MYVYVISAGNIYHKIGISRDLDGRLASLRTAHYHPLQLTASFEREDAAEVERVAHAILAPKRMRGEWFYVSPEVAIRAVEFATLICDDKPLPPEDDLEGAI